MAADTMATVEIAKDANAITTAEAPAVSFSAVLMPFWAGDRSEASLRARERRARVRTRAVLKALKLAHTRGRVQYYLGDKEGARADGHEDGGWRWAAHRQSSGALPTLPSRSPPYSTRTRTHWLATRAAVSRQPRNPPRPRGCRSALLKQETSKSSDECRQAGSMRIKQKLSSLLSAIERHKLQDVDR